MTSQLSLWVGKQKVNTFLNGWFWAFGICIGLWAYWGALELRLINMDERIAVGTRYFVVDPASWWPAAPSPRIPTGYYQMNL